MTDMEKILGSIEFDRDVTVRELEKLLSGLDTFEYAKVKKECVRIPGKLSGWHEWIVLDKDAPGVIIGDRHSYGESRKNHFEFYVMYNSKDPEKVSNVNVVARHGLLSKSYIQTLNSYLLELQDRLSAKITLRSYYLDFFEQIRASSATTESPWV